MEPNVQHVVFLYESLKQHLIRVESKMDKLDKKLDKLMPKTIEEKPNKQK